MWHSTGKRIMHMTKPKRKKIETRTVRIYKADYDMLTKTCRLAAINRTALVSLAVRKECEARK